MSENQSERQCKVCAEQPDREADYYLERDELPDHLYEAHGEDAELVEEYYNPDTRSEVFERLQERGWPPEGETDSGTASGSDRSTVSQSVVDAAEEAAAEQSEDTPDRPDRAADRSSEDTRERDRSTGAAGERDRSSSRGGKWFVLGVGGCGNNLLDTLLLRRNDVTGFYKDIWEAAISNQAMLNTARGDLADTWYASNGDHVWDNVDDFANDHHIPGSEGAGQDWSRSLGRIRSVFEDTDSVDPFMTRFGELNVAELQGAQAVLLLHSCIGGTGSGASPFLAERIMEGVLNESDAVSGTDQSLFSATVIPDQHEMQNGPQIKENCAVGLSAAWERATAVIPFDNYSLRGARSRADIGNWPDPGRCQAAREMEANEAFAAFTEVMSMASSKLETSADQVDINDMHVHARNAQTDETGVVLAPAMIDHVLESPFDESELRTVLKRLTMFGKLVDFEPETAFGARFIFVCPPERESRIRSVTGSNAGVFRRVALGDHSGTTSLRANVVTNPEIDHLQLWATFWSPEMGNVERMLDDLENGPGLPATEADRIRQFRRSLGRDSSTVEVGYDR